jgi:DNA-binding CsgD family transcriptional regulator
MSTKPQELLHAGEASVAKRTREVSSRFVDRCATTRKSSTLDLLLSSRCATGDDSDRVFDHSAIDLPMPSEASLRSLFDLTPAEARLAQRLASGDTVEEVAKALHIKMTTARTQLAAIFAKTETRRQAKLVAILCRIAHLESTDDATRTAALAEEARRYVSIGDVSFAI